MFGYRWEEYVGRNITDFYIDRAQIESILARLSAGDVLRDEPAMIRRKDGRALPILVCSNGHFENGKLAFTRCFSRNASERVARDEALRRSEELLAELREASRAKDEFLAMLGHELRNPLSPIVTALQLMRMRGGADTSGEQAIIRRQVEHMVHLVDDLLDISRIARGKFELKHERADIGAVIAKAVEQASILLETRNHRLQMDVHPQMYCECDPVRLAQVVSNLLTNAARYTAPGGRIRLSACREDDGDLVIRVADNGRGISAEMLPHIFEAFFQGPRGVDRSEGGLGIGLALVRSIVDLHGGHVEAFSAGHGHGSEFVVHLPWVACEDAASPDMPASAVAAGTKARRVLLVDDNLDAAATLAEFLRISGHEVTVCNDAVSALSALRRTNPEVALLDIGLPVMDGYEVARRFREECGDSCRLVALTGYGLETDRARSEAAGFSDHLVKPVELDEVLAVLSR
jgi:signal transduction histidine kinase